MTPREMADASRAVLARDALSLVRWIDRFRIDRPTAMAWSAACLYGAVGIDGLADLTVAHQPGRFAPAVIAILLLSLLLFTLGPRLPLRVLQGNGPLGVALATYASASIDPSLTDPAYLFTLPVIWTGLFFGRRGALGTFGLVLVGEALAAALSGQAGPVQHWIGVTVSVAAVTGVVIALNVRNEKLLVTLHDQALLDPLTQVLNRRGFEQNAARTLGRLPGSDAVFSLVIFDVDLFKQVNDGFGHDIGDQVLVRIAGVLTASSRGGDLVARLGGEEFAALLPGTDAAGAWRFTERARQAAAAGHGALPAVTLSAGIVRGRPGRDLAQLLAEADAALYEAKRLGRDRACIFDAGEPEIPSDGARPAPG